MSQDEAFDPGAPEGERRPGSAYVTRKDVKVVAIALVIGAIFFYPVYKVLARRSEKTRCISNMNGIMSAINQYAIENDDKLPPVFDTGGAGEPMLQSSGAPFTWASNLKDYMKARTSFVCPSADPEELSRSQDPDSNRAFGLSYGMFAPLSTYNISLVEDPNEAVLIGETSNLGADKTFDPLPFKDAGGTTMPFDGMAIGWDNDNYQGNKSTQYVTRLAFPGSAGGNFVKDGLGRHDEGSFVITVTGQLMTVKPPFARVERRNENIYGKWTMPLSITNTGH